MFHFNRGTAIGGLAGGVIGAVAAATQYLQGRAAVAVRPALADVWLVDAVLTGHGWDWVFYHRPGIASIIVIGIAAVITGILGGWWGR